MAKKKGREVLIRIGDGQETENFNALCALTTKALTVNNEEIDVTTADCDTPGGALWTEVLDGVRRIALSGNGISKKDTAEARLMTVSLQTPPVANMEVVVPNFGTFAGAFFVQSMELTGEQSGGASFALTMGSTGAVTFTAEAPAP
ncbi:MULTISPECIES: phage major tail protein, TP901-1 family [Salipiger]|jgi:TP901-1 family phage major tail protein|uniref:Phage major tail protein, TP901-1 family n=1 Tax=Salipiger profundus TaxID=1229727 RepID=A0A1U7D4V0_9RHOB|nr:MULTISPECIES: phage major tail protein, TP901-1 family [Salipiger]APX23194.1 phage major tail protein, TP901-1 family [Salipiger profundus]GGA13973.1 tail protein [Salipiger profundus]SFD16131.1 phage major tail protein, TP901-1 family [Salipiger profundus]